MKKQQAPINKRQLARKLDHIVMPARYDGVTRSARTIAQVKKGKGK
ncbi:MAG: hypothetical protein V4576_03325 [Patescibacteria group bacterium]